MEIILRNLKTNQTPILLRVLAFLLLFVTVFAQELVPNVQAQVGAPQLILTKSIDGGLTTAQVGDVLRYRIRFECSSLTTACGQMEITDVLQAGLIYLPPPASSVPGGFSISYVPATRTITITKDDNNLLDGSQYDAVIAVQVDYDLRPLPAVINNTINGRIDPPGPVSWTNATPSSASPITIGTANPYWGMTKSLSSPIINPTVDTDVTYQIQLCPTTPPPGEGNVPLRNITITDTMPTGAIFVSASDGGTESLGTVTWPVFAGPIYPPNCLTRFVTIRYNTPTFSVGDNVTNTASADGVYTDSGGGTIGPVGVATDPITHPLDPIAEIPTYSKNDTGDPVGISGTARFILNLNTNNTNFPSNELILIDNLPPELRVTSVTSGAWSAAFQHVRAHVEYSTNNGSSYTAFTGSPALYNTNSTYSVGVPAKITNVRWRFEYDPDGLAPFNFTQAGLPYTWSFTTSPEIRVTPRAVATTADPPSGAAMPAAVPGTTYNNCLQVSRRDSTGNPVTDACDIEQMTVRGTFVSLRTSKNETPGGSWDDLSDPTILTFTPDGSILPGDTLRYTITVEVTERSSAPLIDPTIQDTLPAATDFVFVRNGTARLDGTPVAQQPTFTQVGQVLTWAWNNPSPTLTVNPLPLGSRFLTVEFFGYVPRGQTPGSYINNLYVVTDSVDALCEIPTQVTDSADIDGDLNTTEFACENSDPYVVERSAALRGEKWIRSTDPANSQVVDASTFLPAVLPVVCPNGGTSGLPGGGANPFTRYPCISQAFPEGALSPGQFVPPPTNPALDDFEYNLRIFNDGNVPMLNYVLYDILPYVGDTGSGGTLSSSPRLSEFRPGMRGPVQFISGPAGLSGVNFTIEYNNTTNPCRPEVFNQPTGDTVPGSCNNTWTTTWSASALSYRIRLNASSLIPPAATSSEVRFGVPMYIPLDALPVGFDPNDALSREIAWNSFSHVGAYDSDPNPPVVVQDLLASEPRKVGITVPERMSVGNRVWRDADNNGTINAPDDIAPGIAGVAVNLYRDANNDGIADGAAIGTTITDSGGYYLFSNIPYDSAVMNNNRYIIGIPSANFGVGQALESLRSSTGTPAVPTYTNPPSTNGDNNDNGRDPVTPGLEVFSWSFVLQPTTEPTSEADLSANVRDGLAGQRRGVNGERNNNSDLTLDFGFFGGTDIPFSIGNHVWKDNGQTAPGVFNYAERNDGIRQSTEPPVIGVTVRLYRDGNANGIPEAAEMIRTDLTDLNGFYLFDNLDPGPYFVEIAASNFATGQPLAGWYSSQPTGTETLGVNGGVTTADIDNDDNGVNANFPQTTGVFSGVVVLILGTPEPLGETYLSGEADPGPPANQGYNPTGWDGPGSIGRFGETDATSNITIDFGFIPPMSLGNRVWFDEGAGTTPFRSGYNNGLQDGTEVGVSGVTVQLWRDTNATPGLQVSGPGPDTLMDTDTTDATGYYLFERLQPANNYFVHIRASNFTGAGPLVSYLSSTDTNQTTAPADDLEDTDDDGIDSATPATTGITSPQIVMSYNGEPLTPADETDINTSGVYGPLNVGNYGQEDGDGNLTMDFGFVRPPRSLGNRLWIDTNNSGVVDGGEPPVPTGVRVSLYLDANANGIPDDFNGDTVFDNNDAIAFDLTDVNGYYLFDDLPPNNYIVGVDRLNFVTGGLLDGYNSSKGSVDNASNNTDDRDNGVDRLLRADPVASPHGILSTRINLTSTPVSAPTGEVGSGDTSATLGFNPTAGDGPLSRGRFGETDANSDLTIDFGFFVPMSLGNRVFRDDGMGGGTYNNGIMDGGEAAIANVRVELYRDANTDGVPDGASLGFDTTDAGGYYLFDDLAEGSYVVLIPSTNFIGVGPLVGYNTSIPTGTENVGVVGNPYTPNTDRDDNGINVATPVVIGILSGTIALVHDSEPTGETELSGQVDPGSPANLAFNPTGWDGPTSRGRWDESDANSNLTIDFGFIPIFSLGNRVWFDTDNSSTINGAELGINGVTLDLYAAGDLATVLGTQITINGGYYLFNNLQARDYVVAVRASNFSGVLSGYWSSATSRTAAGALTETSAAIANTDIDSDDNGTLQTIGTLNGAVISSTVTLGPTATAEPSGETDLDGGDQGQPDTQANMTIDFGFYTMTLGDLVWNDLDNSGLLDGAEVGFPGVTVELRSGDNSTLLATTTTNGSGIYTFSGLPTGDYIVRLSASNFNPGGILRDYRSSTGPLPTAPYEPAPDADTDTTNSDDNGSEANGILGLGGYVQTLPVTLTPAGEEFPPDDATGTTTEFRVDLGVNNSPQIDLSVTKTDNQAFYIAGGTLNYVVTITNNGPADANGMTVDDALPAQIVSWTWACSAGTPASYNCTDAASSSTAFADSLDLPQLASVTYNVTAQVAPTATGDLDNTVTVTPPTGMTDMTPPDNTATDIDEPASLTVTKDDGVSIVAPGATLTYQLLITNIGAVNLADLTVTDTLPADVTYQSAAPAPATTPPAGTPGGTLTWTGLSLAAGGLPITLQVTVQVSNTPVATSITNSVTVTDSPTGATGNASDTDNIAVSNVKILTGTSEISSGNVPPTNPEPVFIGETLIYLITITVPPGTMTGLTATDILESGLAFDECTVTGVTFSDPLLTSTLPGCPAAAGDPNVTNNGHQVIFDFGDVTNLDAVDQTITVEYQVVVLDIAANIDGVTGINNHVTWTWDGGTLEGEANPVEIIEPDLSIDKSAQPQIAPYGVPITFTIDIAHTADSSANAFDVVVGDVLPPGLAYINGSVVVTGLAATSFIYDPVTTTLTFVWDVFPLGQSASITFQASFIGPSPVTNTASVVWTSLPIDPALPSGPPVQQSTYNVASTERWYDPLNAGGVNNYGISDSVSIRIPARLPDTGFAPGLVTSIPMQPFEKQYTAINDMLLEIPALKLKMSIVGVPATRTGWDLTWLANQAGYLEGTTFPTQIGTSGITGHVYLPDGTPGPFLHLGDLIYGNQIILRANGQRYIYEVRTNQVVLPRDLFVFKNDGYTWLTLVTCKEYNEKANTYSKRVAVRAVLLKVEVDR